MRTDFVERRGRLKDLNRSFDINFWQSQTPQARFKAAWELIVYASQVKGHDVRQLRLHRAIETFQRQQRYTHQGHKLTFLPERKMSDYGLHQYKYLVIGGCAFIQHAEPRCIMGRTLAPRPIGME